MYNVLDNIKLLKLCYEDIYSNCNFLIKIFECITCDSVIVSEKFFYFKTSVWLRNRMIEEKLIVNLALLNVHKDVEITSDEVID